MAAIEPKLSENSIALKEWAVVCQALAIGRQTLIVRKGGIREGREGFRVQHAEFWLFPTAFHQQPESLTFDARPLLDVARQSQPVAGIVRLELYAVVERVIELQHVHQLTPLAGLQILSPAVIEERFNYRQLGLFVPILRVFRAAEPMEVADLPAYAGCRSWVEMAGAVSARSLTPVLTDEEFQRQSQQIEQALRVGAG